MSSRTGPACEFKKVERSEWVSPFIGVMEGRAHRLAAAVLNSTTGYTLVNMMSYRTHNPFTGHSRDCDGADINNGSSHSSFVLRHALRVLPSTHKVAHTMGVGGGGTLLYRSPELNLRQLHAVLTARASRTDAAPPGQQRRPCVDVDANQVGYTQLHLASGPTVGTFYVGRGIGISGADITYVCDGAC